MELSHTQENVTAAHFWVARMRTGLGRIFGRHLLNAALLVLAGGVFGGFLSNGDELIKDPDIWWHLADARILCTTHHFIHADPYSFTVRGANWIDPEWLSELPYWTGYVLFGLAGVHLVALIGFCVNLILVYFRSAWKAQHAGAAFWTALLCCYLMAINSGARTIVIAYVAMNLEMAILEAAEKGKARWLWLLPPLFCLWINLHGSWIIGIGLLGLYILCGLSSMEKGAFQQQAFPAAERNRLLLIFLASVAALMANPYGWRLIWNPFDMLLNQKLMIAITEEWQPLNMGAATGKAVAVFIVLAIVANCLRGRKWKLYELAFIFFAWYVALVHQRFLFLACVITAPLFTADLARSFFGSSSPKTIPALNVLFVAGVVAVLIHLFPREAVLERDLAAAYPLKSIDRIQPSWRTLNDYALGGIMDFSSKPTFIDSRNDIFEHHGVLQKYLDIENARNPIPLLEANGIDHVLTQEGSSLAFDLEQSPDWRVEIGEGEGGNEYKLFAKASGR